MKSKSYFWGLRSTISNLWISPRGTTGHHGAPGEDASIAVTREWWPWRLGDQWPNWGFYQQKVGIHGKITGKPWGLMNKSVGNDEKKSVKWELQLKLMTSDQEKWGFYHQNWRCSQQFWGHPSHPVIPVRPAFMNRESPSPKFPTGWTDGLTKSGQIYPAPVSFTEDGTDRTQRRTALGENLPGACRKMWLKS